MRAIRLILCYIVTVPLGQSTFTDNYLSFEGPVAYDDEKYENTTAANPVSRFLHRIILEELFGRIREIIY